MSETARPNTFFSGGVGPQGDRPGPNGIVARIGMYLLFIILFPFAMLVYGVWLALFTYARLPWWIPISSGGVLLLGGLVTGNVSLGTVEFYFKGYVQFFSDMVTHHRSFAYAFSDNIGQIIVGQLWFGILIATIVAGVVCAFKYVRRPAWKEIFIKPGPVLKRREKKTTLEIQAGLNSPVDGITLGLSHDRRDPRYAGGDPGTKYGQRVVLSRAELASHALVTGGSNSGKTTTMLIGIRDAIRMGHGVVMIDCKASPQTSDPIAEWAKRYGRDFFHWSIRDDSTEYMGPAESPAYYDPISRGDASRRKDLLMGSQRWDVEYYKEIISNYLQTVFRVIDLVPALPGVDTFTDVADLLNPNVLIRRASYVDAEVNPDIHSTLMGVANLDAMAMSGINGMYSRLHTLTSSSAGKWLRKDPEGKNDIDLRRVADEGQVVVFSLDGDLYEGTASLIAGLIIQDLKTVASELRHDEAESPIHVYMDEFSAVDTSNLVGLLARSRDAQMSVMLATQTLSDLARNDPNFPKQVIGIIGAFIVHRANTEDDARTYAGLSGVVRKITERMSIEESSGILGTMGAATAMGSGYTEERDGYQVNIGDFQDLDRGEAILIIKSPHNRFINPVKVILEPPLGPMPYRGDPALPVKRHIPRVNNRGEKRVTYPHPVDVANGVVPDPYASKEVKVKADNVLAPIMENSGNMVIPTNPGRPGPSRPKRPSPKSQPAGIQAGAPLSLPQQMSAMKPKPAQVAPAAPRRPTLPEQPSNPSPQEWNGIP